MSSVREWNRFGCCLTLKANFSLKASFLSDVQRLKQLERIPRIRKGRSFWRLMRTFAEITESFEKLCKLQISNRSFFCQVTAVGSTSVCIFKHKCLWIKKLSLALLNEAWNCFEVQGKSFQIDPLVPRTPFCIHLESGVELLEAPILRIHYS